MEFVVNQKLLSQALNKIRTVVDKKTANEKLQYIFLNTEGNRLLIKATDKEIVVPQHIDLVEVSESGSTMVPAHLFGDIIKRFPDGCGISLKVMGSTIEISYGKTKFNLNILSADNFPNVSMDQKFSVQVNLSVDDFLVTLSKIKCAISSDEIRYYLNGMFLHINDSGNLVAVSTDAHKLSRRILSNVKVQNLDDKNILDSGIIIPRKTINEIHKFIDPKLSELVIKISSSAIQFEQNWNVIFYSNLIDGIFPDYQGILVNDSPLSKVSVPNVEDLLEAIGRVSLLSGDNSKRIIFKLTKNNLEVSVADSRIGSAVDSVLVLYDGDDKSIVFNSAYALAILDNFTGSVEIGISTKISPVMIHSADDKDMTYVLMPMHGN